MQKSQVSLHAILIAARLQYLSMRFASMSGLECLDNQAQFLSPFLKVKVVSSSQLELGWRVRFADGDVEGTGLGSTLGL